MIPLVSVGIPVFNGGGSLRHAIESVLAQTFTNLEVVISDNASQDDTPTICEEFARIDPRVRWHRLPRTVGAVENFGAVLKAARGDVFMWLGHDDWIDDRYIERCAQTLNVSPDVALVCGHARYYRDGEAVEAGRVVNLLSDNSMVRVVKYLARVRDNGTFYGLVRREAAARLGLSDVMGGDWLLLAALAHQGKIVTLPDVTVHRELGGNSRTYAQIVRSSALPAWNARWPKVALTLAVFMDIAWHSPAYANRSMLGRVALAGVSGGCVGLRALLSHIMGRASAA